MKLVRLLRSLFAPRSHHSSGDEISEMQRALSQISKQGVQPNTILDVGVGNGTNDLYTAFPNAHLFLVEPLIEFEDTIKSILSTRHGGYSIAAAGAKQSKQTLNVHPDHLEGSSLYNEVTPTIDNGEPRVVPVVTLDQVVHDNQLKKPYLIKVDAQGHEIEIMRGASEILHSTDVVVLEVLLYKFLTDNPIFHDVVSFMHSQNFVCYDIFGLSHRPKDQALAHLDIVFVKEDGPLRKIHDWE